MKNLALLSLFIPALALAQPKSADDYYKEGETQYNLGNFLKAVEAFKAGYAAEPNDSKKSVYLYNIAQAYRQAKDCAQSQFFYKRYLALKDADTVKPLKPEKRAEIETILNELNVCVQQQEALKNRQPDTTNPPDNTVTPPDDKGNKGKVVGDGSTTNGGDDGEDGEDGEDGGSIRKGTEEVTTPKLLSVRVTGGAAKIFTGPDIKVPVQASFALLGGYPLTVAPQVSLDIGAGFTFTPIPLEGMGTAKLMSLLANAAGTYHATPKIGLRADAGVGVLMLAGASGSRFTGGRMTDGALTMINVRLGLSADYAITPNVVATLTPFAFSYSPPKTGLDDSIKSITAIDFMVGVGYRM